MSDNVLYFPYIDIPPSNWLTRTLLYWDSVGVIMPQDLLERPEELEQFTIDLMSTGLLSPIIPAQYLFDFPNFSDSFASYISSLGTELDRRRRNFRKNLPRGHKTINRIHLEKLGLIPIHLQKMEGLSAALVDEGLAKIINPPWVSVEGKTAEEFMYYLAVVLGGHKHVGFTPVTDTEKRFKRFTLSAKEHRNQKVLENLRIEVLKDILPAPAASVPVNEIARFKERFGDRLGAFRRHIEMEILVLADMQDTELRQTRLRLFQEDCEQEILELRARMEESGWPNIVFGKLCALIALVPIVGQAASWLKAAYTVLGSGPPKEINSRLAYAAYAQKRLLDN
jgi:hypothetical protein